MQKGRILISGAGIAGPSLAYWLARYGYTPTIVERAPSLREGGQAVDFRGSAHLTVLARMGILEEVRRLAAPGGPVSFVDEDGRPLATMSPEIASGDVEILRGHLGRILFAATQNETEYLFGDSITGIEQTADQVLVTFAHHSPRQYDLVIGADGLHSAVRSLTFGPESQFVHHSGYYVAIASIDDPGTTIDGGRLYSVPGRTAGVTHAGNAARAVFYFAAPSLSYDRRGASQQKRLVADVFADMKWETPRLLSAMDAARDFYLDSICEVRVPSLSEGRVALLGDAGYGGTIGGMGTGLAVVAAYILAGELAVAGGDHITAFRRYEERIRTYAERCQRGARRVGTFMAPRSRLGIAIRNGGLRVANLLPGKGLMERIAMRRASDVTFGEYPDSSIDQATLTSR